MTEQREREKAGQVGLSEHIFQFVYAITVRVAVLPLVRKLQELRRFAATDNGTTLDAVLTLFYRWPRACVTNNERFRFGMVAVVLAALLASVHRKFSYPMASKPA